MFAGHKGMPDGPMWPAGLTPGLLYAILQKSKTNLLVQNMVKIGEIGPRMSPNILQTILQNETTTLL